MNKNNNDLIVPVVGMHCKSCEILIEDELGAVPGIKTTKADWRKSSVNIRYSGAKPDATAIEDAIGRAGYKVGTEQKSGFFSRNKHDYEELSWAFLFLVGLYLLLRGLGLTSLSVNTSGGITVPIIIMVGLTAGFSTCMALAGGLILGISAKFGEAHPEATPAQKFYPHLFFNSGRILSYMVLGGLLGLLGSAFQLSGTVLGVITLAVSALMLIMGLQLIEIFPWAHKIKFTLPKSLSRAFGLKERQEGYSHNNAFILGALTFFLPCGFTQAMQVYAVSTGSFWGGAITMGAFALGTMPGLLSIGGLTSVVKGRFARGFFKFAGLAVIAFGLLDLSNGLNLTGLNLAWAAGSGKGSVSAVASDPNVTIENGVQVVHMAETNDGYVPNSFTIQKGIPVKWVIDAQAPYSCASTILLNQYGIRKNLTAGENDIEFTPSETGRIPFSCSMGMYTGVFNVVDGNSQAAAGPAGVPAALADNNAAAPSPAVGGGTCGVSGGGCGCGGGSNFTWTPQSGTVSTAGGEKSAEAQPTQDIESSFTVAGDITPNTFTVKAGQPVHYVVDAKEDGVGCMSTIMIPGLYNQAIPIVAGQPLALDFTPTTPGSYQITCAMGVPRGKIIVE